MPDRVKTQCCTLVISGKGVVNFSKWICGSGREFNVCVIPSPIQRIKGAPLEPRGRALSGPSAQARGHGAWWPLICWTSWGWGRPPRTLWPCSHRSRQSCEALLLWGKWVGVNQQALWGPSTYISEAGAKGKGGILAKEAKAVVSGPCCISLVCPEVC